MTRNHTPHWITRALALTLAAALLGCGSRAPAPSGTGDDPAGQPGAHNPRGVHLTREQRQQAERNHARTITPQAYAVLRSLGLQTPSAPHLPTRHTSLDLPISVEGSASYTPGGSGWIQKSADVTVAGSSMQLTPAGSTFPANFSYIIYRVDDVIPEPRSIFVAGSPLSQPFGVCAYNWAYGSTGGWEPVFFGQTDDLGYAEVHLDEIDSPTWTNSGGDFACAVFCLNPTDFNLSGFTLSQVTANDPPFALLDPSPASGHAPLSVSLNAGASHDDDGTIANYSFDPLGDGIWIDNGADPILDFEYVDPGAYQAQVLVTDNGGLTDTWTSTVVVSPALYDEVEPNNGHVGANPLPALPFGPFFGNIGAGGYDGGIEDVFTFDADAGDEVAFRIQFADSVAPNFMLTLEDSFSNPLYTSFGDSPQSIYYKFQGWEIEPFYLTVRNDTGNTDYMLTADDMIYEEFENNDGPASAQRLDSLADMHAMADFDGNIGAGGPEDGDNDDWYYFGTGGPNFHLHYTLTYDPAVDVGVNLTDFEGDVLISKTGGGGVETIDYDFQPDDAEPYYLEVTATNGTCDYTQNATLSLTNPGYFEQEDNDTFGSANPIGVQPDFTGNIGSGGDYDGDNNDWFTFAANPGDKLHWVVTLSAPTPGFQALIFDSSGARPIGGIEVSPANDELDIHAVIRTQDVGPFYFYLENFGPAVNYSIDGAVDSFSEVETNDDHATANFVPDTPFQFFSGNLGGGGGAEYNGGPVDMFAFNADLGDNPVFTVFYDEGTGLIDGIIHDADGDAIGFGTNGGDGTMTFNLVSPIGAGDTAPYYLELTAASLWFDYWISRSEAL